VKVPRTAVWLLGLAILHAWVAGTILKNGRSGSLALLAAALVMMVVACVIIAGSHHNQRCERLGREADAQNRPQGSKEIPS
jgi:peptidoglycan/LPS O-acetylase OafA/YrhL